MCIFSMASSVIAQVPSIESKRQVTLKKAAEIVGHGVVAAVSLGAGYTLGKGFLKTIRERNNRPPYYPKKSILGELVFPALVYPFLGYTLHKSIKNIKDCLAQKPAVDNNK